MRLLKSCDELHKLGSGISERQTCFSGSKNANRNITNTRHHDAKRKQIDCRNRTLRIVRCCDFSPMSPTTSCHSYAAGVPQDRAKTEQMYPRGFATCDRAPWGGNGMGTQAVVGRPAFGWSCLRRCAKGISVAWLYATVSGSHVAARCVRTRSNLPSADEPIYERVRKMVRESDGGDVSCPRCRSDALACKPAGAEGGLEVVAADGAVEV